MGFYLEKAQKIFRFPLILRLQASYDLRIATKIVHEMHHLFFEEIQENFEKYHLVTRALREESKFYKLGKRAAKKTEVADIDVTLQQQMALKSVSQMEGSIEKFKERHPRLDKEFIRWERELSYEIIKIMKGVEREDRDLYFDFIQPLMLGRLTIATIIKNIKTKWNVSALSRIAIRLEESRINRGLHELKHDRVQVEKLLRELEEGLSGKAGKREEYSHIIRKLGDVKELLKEHLKLEFENVYLIFKRSFILQLLSIYYVHTNEKKCFEWMRKNLAPHDPLLKIIRGKNAKKMKEILEKGMREMAQAFRIMINEEVQIERKSARIGR